MENTLNGTGNIWEDGLGEYQSDGDRLAKAVALVMERMERFEIF